MNIVRLLLTLGAALVVSCARDPTGPDPNAPRILPLADFSQDWSHDGKLIAYRRAYPSTDGPPGIYLVGPWGGIPRLLIAGSFFSPASMHFSPDDRHLVGRDGLGLFIVDVETGSITHPLYTNSLILYCDWSPDGKTIAYDRASLDLLPPPDSSGLHLLDLTTGTDRPVNIRGERIHGLFFAYAPDGRLACAQLLPDGYHDRIIVINPDVTDYSVAYDPHGLKLIANVRWYWRPSLGIISLIFEQQIRPGGSWLVNADGTALRPFPHFWTEWDALSPNGDEFVTEGLDPDTFVGILDVQRTDDFSEATRRHITSYRPAP